MPPATSSTTVRAAPGRARARKPSPLAWPWLLAAILAAIYLLVDPPSADLAAQTLPHVALRAPGFVLWDNGWYGGHHIPAYSILFPPLAALTSPQLVGAIAAAVVGVGVRADRGGTPGARPAAYWFAIATLVSLVTGRLTFALGARVRAARRPRAGPRRGWCWCAVAGVAAALASPVAAAFLAIVAAWRGGSRGGAPGPQPRCSPRRSRPRSRSRSSSPRAAASRSRRARSGRRWPARCW